LEFFIKICAHEYAINGLVSIYFFHNDSDIWTFGTDFLVGSEFAGGEVTGRLSQHSLRCALQSKIFCFKTNPDSGRIGWNFTSQCI
jgi:hypothetical protein